MAESVVETLLEKERALLHPQNRANATFLRTMLTPDFVEIGASGRRFELDDIIELLLEAPCFDGERSIEDFTATELDQNTWIAHYRIPESRTQRTSIWQRHGESWKMRFHQGTIETN